MNWIAEELFDVVYPDGRRVAGRIAIGLPRLDADGVGFCEMAIEPLVPGTRTTQGEGTLQALVAAIHFAGSMIAEFLKRGGRIVERGTDENIAIGAVLGPLLTAD